ncbi:MAG: DNA polymerase ligase N-terminal domain-containing protein [Pirellulaceae bacterium]|nr:DNA polymerase ligase N-terminal domain-containing protein [Pirellulaceae bacterium]MDP7014703.1 DNA polymerase ligase N-terminal domain-containing protein [Pirellulaceae bacterium]
MNPELHFVILRHETPAESPRPSHWDLMLEVGHALRTWAIDEIPGPAPVAADRLPDHRLAYLDYEGAISNNRGVVTRWDRGVYTTIAAEEGVWRVRLCGSQLCGELVIDDRDQRSAITFRDETLA